MHAPSHWWWFAIATTALLTGAAAAQTPPPPGPPTELRIPDQQHQLPIPEAEPTARAAVPVFEFHSAFWVNLHHFLYQQARIRAAGGKGTNARQTARMPDLPSAAALTGAERSAWTSALDYYAADLIDRDLLFNGDMVHINNRLAEMENCPDLTGRTLPACASGLRPEFVAVLERAAPVYRAQWWPEQNRANRAWIAHVSPLVSQYGAQMARQLAAAYEENWPAGVLRVDVVWYGGPLGAYTTLNPPHLTISSADVNNQGGAALEILFHEASHTVAREVRDAIARECRQRSKPIPRDLWHALIFYTTGEVVRRVFEDGRTGGRLTSPTEPLYTPYAYRFGLYRGAWDSYRRVLERYWQPYLDGKVGFESAIARLVSAT